MVRHHLKCLCLRYFWDRRSGLTQWHHPGCQVNETVAAAWWKTQKVSFTPSENEHDTAERDHFKRKFHLPTSIFQGTWLIFGGVLLWNRTSWVILKIDWHLLFKIFFGRKQQQRLGEQKHSFFFSSVWFRTTKLPDLSSSDSRPNVFR